MKSRFIARSLVTAAALLAGAGVTNAQAPIVRTPPRADTPRMIVQVFGSADRVAGPLASDDLRERLIRAFPSRILWVIPRAEIIQTLFQSGYDTLQQVAPSDEATLAKSQRADEYISGRVVKDGANFKVEAWLVLTRDNSLTQPLPVATGTRADRATANLVRAIQDARKQLDDEKKCVSAARDNKLAEAIAAADAGIVEYPQATLVRYCKLNVLVRQKASDSALVAIANEILAIDANSTNALAVSADAYKRMGNTTEAVDRYIRLLAANPNDAEMQQTVINVLAAAGEFARARDFVEKAIANAPGDVGLTTTYVNILLAMKDVKMATKVGEELMAMDTSTATPQFMTKMILAYDADSQPQKAAELAARATQKHDKDADLWQLQALMLKRAGQVQQSIAAAKRALEINPKIANGWYQIAVAYNELSMPDSVLMALRNARAAGDPGDNLAQVSLQIGNRLYRAAAADSNKTVEMFEAAMPYLYFADSTATNPQLKNPAALLVGVSHYYVAQIIATGLAQSKNCDLAKKAQNSIAESMIYVQRGGRDNPQQAGQVMGALNQLQPYIEQQVKTLCK